MKTPKCPDYESETTAHCGNRACKWSRCLHCKGFGYLLGSWAKAVVT